MTNPDKQTTTPKPCTMPEIAPCPFCKKQPIFGLAKKNHCSLHGEPMQDATLACRNVNCPARPSVTGGDVYNGGKFKAQLRAAEKWNLCRERADLVEKMKGE